MHRCHLLRVPLSSVTILGSERWPWVIPRLATHSPSVRAGPQLCLAPAGPGECRRRGGRVAAWGQPFWGSGDPDAALSSDILHSPATFLSGKEPDIPKPLEEGGPARVSSPQNTSATGGQRWLPRPPRPPHSRGESSPSQMAHPTFSPPHISSTSITGFVKARNTFIESTIGCAKPQVRRFQTTSLAPHNNPVR